MEDLKTTYRELTKQHHPDCGGSIADMQEINNEYSELVKRFANSETTTADDEHNAAADAETYRDIINALLHFSGLQIEICGTWIWVSGDTLPARSALKELRFMWASKKQMWYWHRPEDTAVNHKTWDMEQIRNKYGSQVVKGEPVKAIA